MRVAINAERVVVQVVAVLVDGADRNPVREVVKIQFNIVQVVVRPSTFVEVPLFNGFVDGRLVLTTRVDLGILSTCQYPRHDDCGQNPKNHNDGQDLD